MCCRWMARERANSHLEPWERRESYSKHRPSEVYQQGPVFAFYSYRTWKFRGPVSIHPFYISFVECPPPLPPPMLGTLLLCSLPRGPWTSLRVCLPLPQYMVTSLSLSSLSLSLCLSDTQILYGRITGAGTGRLLSVDQQDPKLNRPISSKVN